MLPYALALLLVGWLLLYSAVKGSNPLDELRAAVGRA